MKLGLKKLALAVSAGASVLLGPAIASAATITISYTGTVTFVSFALGGQFAVGDALTGTLVLDTAATASSCGTACAIYASPAQAFSATVGSYGLSGVGFEQLVDDVDDVWGFSTSGSAAVSGPAVNGFPLSGFGLGLVDSSGTALSGLSLVPPVFSDYQQTIFSLVFRSGAETFVRGTVTSLAVVDPTPPTPTTVPEPASLILLGTGLIMCSRRRAESRRRRS